MLIANLVGIKDTTAPQHSAIIAFILSSQDGELTFTNDCGETYTMIRKNLYMSLRHPFKDYTGDPDVVARFNTLNFAKLSVLDNAA